MAPGLPDALLVHAGGRETSASGPQYARPGSPVGACQKEVAREHSQRAEELGRKLSTPEGAEGPMTKEMKPCGSGFSSPSSAPLPRCPRTWAPSPSSLRRPSQRAIPSSSPYKLWRRGACTSSAGRFRAARPTRGWPASYLTAARTSSTTDLGQPAAQEARPTTRSSNGTTTTTATALGTYFLADQTSAILPNPAPPFGGWGSKRKPPLPEQENLEVILHCAKSINADF